MGAHPSARGGSLRSAVLLAEPATALGLGGQERPTRPPSFFRNRVRLRPGGPGRLGLPRSALAHAEREYSLTRALRGGGCEQEWQLGWAGLGCASGVLGRSPQEQGQGRFLVVPCSSVPMVPRVFVSWMSFLAASSLSRGVSVSHSAPPDGTLNGNLTCRWRPRQGSSTAPLGFPR